MSLVFQNIQLNKLEKLNLQKGCYFLREIYFYLLLFQPHCTDRHAKYKGDVNPSSPPLSVLCLPTQHPNSALLSLQSVPSAHSVAAGFQIRDRLANKPQEIVRNLKKKMVTSEMRKFYLLLRIFNALVLGIL